MVQLESIQNTFIHFIEKMDAQPLEVLNRIPAGFNNNPIWNFGHAVVSSYALAFIRPKVDEQYHIPFWDKYKIDSRPESPAGIEEYEALKKMAMEFVPTIRQAIAAQNCDHITPFSTGTFGAELSTITDILTTIMAHNALHYGIAASQAKVIGARDNGPSTIDYRP